MYAIQENELDQLRDLTTFLDLELNFFAQALELLQEVKNGWTDEWASLLILYTMPEANPPLLQGLTFLGRTARGPQGRHTISFEVRKT
jgi:hypothetical protein